MSIENINININLNIKNTDKLKSKGVDKNMPC